jgi:hypothetical protein
MPTRMLQSADTVDTTVESMATQSDPRTPSDSAKSPKRKNSIAGSIRRSLSSLFGRPPSPPEPAQPSSNKCRHCNITGHWSNDCPILCTICALQKGKEYRGHEAKDCRPTCTTCSGSGIVKRRTGDERPSEALELLAALVSIRTIAQDFAAEHCGNQTESEFHLSG